MDYPPTNPHLIGAAWLAREKAYPWKTGTKVGCAIRSSKGGTFGGQNIEGLWMTSIHAEVSAIIKMVGHGQRGVEIAIVADCENFTPCGACLDWLMQFCDPESPITIGNMKHKEGHTTMILKDLYPSYPRQ